jgi:hypothetical protein
MESKGCALLLKILLIVDLERDNVIRLSMDASFDTGEGALTNLKTDLEIMNLE